jgi:hypothetical protein
VAFHFWQGLIPMSADGQAINAPFRGLAGWKTGNSREKTPVEIRVPLKCLSFYRFPILLRRGNGVCSSSLHAEKRF